MACVQFQVPAMHVFEDIKDRNLLIFFLFLCVSLWGSTPTEPLLQPPFDILE